MSKIERFKEIVAEMATLYENKNKDYGDSFGKSIKEHGYVAGIVRMEDKFNRLKNLLLSFEEPNFESISDTLTDLANYAIMMRMEIEDEEEAQKYFSESVSDLDEMKKNILKGLADRFKELAGKIFDDDIFCTIKF